MNKFLISIYVVLATIVCMSIGEETPILSTNNIFSITQLERSQLFYVKDLMTDTVLINKTFNNYCFVNEIISINETTALLFANFDSLVSIDLMSGDCNILSTLKFSKINGSIQSNNNQIIYVDNMGYVPVSLSSVGNSVAVLNYNFNFKESIVSYNLFSTPGYNYGTSPPPVGAYDYHYGFMYVLYQKILSNGEYLTNLIQYSLDDIENSQKFIYNISGIDPGFINIMFCDKHGGLFIGYSDVVNKKFEICQINIASSSCSTVVTTDLAHIEPDFVYEPWYLSGDLSNHLNLIITNIPQNLNYGIVEFKIFNTSNFSLSEFNITNEWINDNQTDTTIFYLP